MSATTGARARAMPSSHIWLGMRRASLGGGEWPLRSIGALSCFASRDIFCALPAIGRESLKRGGGGTPARRSTDFSSGKPGGVYQTTFQPLSCASAGRGARAIELGSTGTCVRDRICSTRLETCLSSHSGALALRAGGDSDTRKRSKRGHVENSKCRSGNSAARVAQSDRDSSPKLGKYPKKNWRVHMRFTDGLWYPGKVTVWSGPSGRHPHGYMNIKFDDGEEVPQVSLLDPNVILENQWPSGCAQHPVRFKVDGGGCPACNALRQEEGAGAGPGTGAGAAPEEEEPAAEGEESLAAAQDSRAQGLTHPREAAAAEMSPRRTEEGAGAGATSKEGAPATIEREESRAAEPEAPAPAVAPQRAPAAGPEDTPALSEEELSRPSTPPATEEPRAPDAPEVSSPYRRATASASATVDAAAEAVDAVTASALAEEAERVAQEAEARQQRLKLKLSKPHKQGKPCWRETTDEEGEKVSEMQNGFTLPPSTAWRGLGAPAAGPALRSADAPAESEDRDPEREQQFEGETGDAPTTAIDLKSIAAAFGQIVEAVQHVYARPSTAAAISTDRQGVLSALVDGMHAAIEELQENSHTAIHAN